MRVLFNNPRDEETLWAQKVERATSNNTDIVEEFSAAVGPQGFGHVSFSVLEIVSTATLSAPI